MDPLPSQALTPYPSLFPLPPPGSSLTLLRAGTSRRPRASGKLGSSLALISPSGNLQTLALAYGSVRTDHLGEGTDEFDGVFTVKADISDEAVVQGSAIPGADGAGGRPVEAGDGAGESEEEGGRWLAKAFMPAWLEFKLEEEAIAKGL